MAPSSPLSLWRFSLAVYGRDRVDEACLVLQDRLGANVNLLLFCCWHPWVGAGAVDRERLRALMQRLEPWHAAVTLRLRRLRRRLKACDLHAGQPSSKAFYAHLLQAELEAERLEQTVLGGPCPARRTADENAPAEAALSLARYLALLGAMPEAEEREALASLLAAAFAPLARDRARQITRAALAADPPLSAGL